MKINIKIPNSTFLIKSFNKKEEIKIKNSLKPEESKKVIENYYYRYEKEREYILVSGIGNDPHNMDYISWSSSNGSIGILKQLNEIKSGYSPSIGFVEFKKYPNDIFIQITRLNSLYKNGWREGKSNLSDETDIGKSQSTKRVYVKPSKRAKGYYREQKVGREEIDPKVENFWDIPISQFSRLISGDKIKLKEEYIRQYSYKLNDHHPELQKLLDLMDPIQNEWKLPTLLSFFESEGVSPHSQAIFIALGAHEKVPLNVLKDYPEAAYSYDIDISDEALEQERPQGKIEHLYEMSKDQYDDIIKEIKKDYNKDPKKVTDSMLNNKYPEELADIKAAAKLRKKIFNSLPKIFQMGFTSETMNEKLHYDIITQMKQSGANISKEVKADYPMLFGNVPVNFEPTNDKDVNKEINGILEEIKLAVGDLKMDSDKDLNNAISDIIDSSKESVPIYIMDEDHDKEKLINSGIDDISKMINPKLLDKIKKSNFPMRIRTRDDLGRSNYNEGIINLGLGVVNSKEMRYDSNTFCHEYGHAIEDMIPGIKDLCGDFLNKRTENEVAVNLRDISRTYNDHEYTKVDHFVDPYVGKIYSDKATEILSMGMGYLTSGFYSMQLFKHDPEFLGFILGIVSGRIGLNDKKESL